jgi:hypothetical protein
MLQVLVGRAHPAAHAEVGAAGNLGPDLKTSLRSSWHGVEDR